MGLFGFALPVVLYTALEEKAIQTGCSCGELVCSILEHTILKEGKINLDNVSNIKTNLITTKSYGNSHACSQEQVKQYLHQPERMPGTAKIGNTWVIPYDTKFPEALRAKSKGLSSKICK